jgi:hypothetical protein
MATIKITRTKEDNNRMRDYQLLIDGQKVGTIANGQTKEFEVPSGQHSIVAKIDWCSSPELSFDSSDTKTFFVGGFKGGNWIMPISLGIIVLHIILKYFWGFDYLMILFIPAALPILYYMTFGRKNYLTLTTTN